MMTNMEESEKLTADIRKFLDVYTILGPEAKAAFEAQMDKLASGTDEKTRALYKSLYKAAKDGLTSEEAIAKMKESLASLK